MGTLYIDRKDLTVKARGGALAFYTAEGLEGTVPMNPLKRVIVVGDVTISASALHALGGRGVFVAFLSGKRLRYRGAFTGPVHNNALLRLRQYEAVRSDRAPVEARGIVARKVAGQRCLLWSASARRPDLRFALTKALRVLDKALCLLDEETELPMETILGIEGGAAASYFGAYTKLFPPSLGFTRRVRRPPTDPVNAMLSLVYTALHWEAVREVQAAGFDPMLGFLHAFEYGRESLACDMVEALRPAADAWVWELFRERVFRARDFASGSERPGTYLKKEARKRFFPLYEKWAAPLRRALVTELRALAGRLGAGGAAAEACGGDEDEPDALPG